MFDTVCADCGNDVSWDDQYGVPEDEYGETKIVCPDCAKKYGYNLDEGSEISK